MPSSPTFLGCEYLHITFTEEEDVEALMNLSSDALLELDLSIDCTVGSIVDEEVTNTAHNHTGPSAASRWISEYEETLQEPQSLEKEANLFMRRFDNKLRVEAEERSRKAKLEEDGWTVVTSAKKTKTADGSARVTGIKADSVILRRSKKSKILDNFYKFQKQEQRQESKSLFHFSSAIKWLCQRGSVPNSVFHRTGGAPKAVRRRQESH